MYKKITIEEQIPDDDDPIWSTPGFYRSLTEEYRDLSLQIAEQHPANRN